jgi:cellobiose phosphorylase
MVGSVEGILGMRPDLEGIRIAPSIPSDWDGLKIEKIFRGSRLHITVKNPDHAQSGCKSLTLNGKLMEGNYIPASEMKEENEIELVM